MSNLVEIKELGKCYGKKKVMNNLSLSLESGRIVGILGPNGSGKSTLIKMMAGVLKPTSGQITINGYLVGVNTKKIVSYLPERTYLNPSMKVKEAVDYFADFYEDFSKQKALDMLEKFGINEQDKIKSLSKGTREKVQIVLVMSSIRAEQMKGGGESLGTGMPRFRAQASEYQNTTGPIRP